jgi:hypothetical protein
VGQMMVVCGHGSHTHANERTHLSASMEVESKMSPPGAHASTRSVDIQRPLRARNRCRSGVLRSLASAGPHCAPPSSACDLRC